jgi:hypothetical protein
VSGSVAAAAKAKLVGTGNVLSGLTGLELFTVAYTPPTRDIPRLLIYGGKVSGPVQLAAMMGGTRIKRTEELNLTLHIRVFEPGHATSEATDIVAAAASTVIENYIAANPTLGGVASLQIAKVESYELEGWSVDEGSCSVVDLGINLLSYLT